MKRRERLLVRVLTTLTVGCCISLSLSAPAAKRKGPAQYWNERWNFCIEYPKDWVTYVPIDGSGVDLRPMRASDGLVSVGALPAQPKKNNPSQLETPSEALEGGLKELAKSRDVQNLTILKKRDFPILSNPAVEITYSYDERYAFHWLVKEIDFTTTDGVAFGISLKVPPEEAPTFEPVFEQIIRSLKLNCRPPAKSAGQYK